MRVLLDTCIPRSLHDAWVEPGHEVAWAALQPLDPGDAELLERARREDRVLVTMDKDFGELAVVRRLPHAGIIRLVG